ncbi:CRISPR-associated protein Cas4 [Halorarum halobium]|uniref:CRISPR-associated protein Cas4 n=1 Tax=Halorarum halobium TaxID=3075121 RepID=UPI0028AE8187|nr:Dna2/Cas4 domain-containing protein [Halobaculum sp. XH14]
MPAADLVAFSDLARAAYCPRQLYYVRREDREPPSEATERIDLAFRYPELRAADDAALRTEPVDRPPDEYRGAMDLLAGREEWADLTDPAATRTLLEGKDCRGIAHKVLEPDDESPVPTIVSPGDPPEQGVWEPQAVRAVAAAKALAWERQREVPRAFLEYPTHGVVREVRLTVRKKATYRRVLRTVTTMDGPPPRLTGSDKCDSCHYREQCGVKTRSLRSWLGL